jgi:hypothetical protein
MTPNYPKKLETNEQQQQQEEKWFLEPPFAVKKCALSEYFYKMSEVICLNPFTSAKKVT